MAVTQRDLALQMLAQLRVLDPSVSAEVGTPERKILDTVAEALTDAQVDLTQLSGALDVDSKVGTNLDKFLALFGFGRQDPTRATGFVQFGREENAPSNVNIRIPVGTQITTSADNVAGLEATTSPIYETTFEVTLAAGDLSTPIPVRALVAGTTGNLEAGHSFTFAGAYVFGITKMSNSVPITGGADQEDDDALKVRFKNTVFRNLAGTEDQYMALAASTAYTTKVNVVGPISRYREYIQVPAVDDATGIDVDPVDAPVEGPPPAQEPGHGFSGEWTSALSTVPYSKHTYETVPTFISNGKTGTQTVFYREEVDWRLNTLGAAKNAGDAYREAHAEYPQDVDPLSAEANRDDSTAIDSPGSARPNVTFLNIYEGVDPDVEAIRPGDIVLFEHSYMSTASRNNFSRNIMNAVDVFIDGSNDTIANTIVPSPLGTTASFVIPTNDKYSYRNYRRVGQPDDSPQPEIRDVNNNITQVGHIFIPLFWQPVTKLPSEITIAVEGATAIFYLGEHYWLVEDTTELYGTVRARNGIEWDGNAKGALSSTDGVPGNRSGLRLSDFPSGTPINILGYSFDKNVIDLQAALEAQKQVTTDILVHRARTRYFKLDITVMYGSGYNTSLVNDEIRNAVSRYFSAQYFGNVIQLSDLLSVVHSVSGVDNVRWSSDVYGSIDASRVYETNSQGTTRPVATGASTRRVYNNDFFLKDDELPALAEAVDTVGFLADPVTANRVSDQYRADHREFAVRPGLIIRSRAQNTWIKS